MPSGRSASGSPGRRWNCWCPSPSASGCTTTSGRSRTWRSPRSLRRRTSAVRGLARQTEDERRAGLEELISQMRAELAAAGVRARVEARARHLYSIHRDLPEAGRLALRRAAADRSGGAGRGGAGPTLRPTDMIRVVVVVDGAEADCYVALGALHGRWQPVDERFRDYISMPKYNMYRSLHTAVLVDGEPVGVLIRTPAMDAVATYGVAARIREAGGKDGRVTADLARQADLDWLDRLLAWQPLAAPGELPGRPARRPEPRRHGRVHAGRHAGEAARPARPPSTSPTRSPRRPPTAPSACWSTGCASRWRTAWRTARWST